MRARAFLLLLLLVAASGPAFAQPAKPKLGSSALPIQAATEHLRTAPAPDYWRLQAFYVPQETSSACSVASVAMAINSLRGVPHGADVPLVTQKALLEAVGDDGWTARTVENGDGVTFAELLSALARAARAYDLAASVIEVFRPADASAAALDRLRAALLANEASDQDVALVYFNQGVVTGDWDGPHISPVGAYDAARDRVLLMDVDREWYVPYWTPVPTLMAAMLKPTGAQHGPLAGETGGLVVIRRGE